MHTFLEYWHWSAPHLTGACIWLGYLYAVLRPSVALSAAEAAHSRMSLFSLVHVKPVLRVSDDHAYLLCYKPLDNALSV